MSIKAEYIVRKLPQSFVTYENVSAYEQDPAPDADSPKPPKRLVQKQVESRGGWLVIFPGGHSIRLTSEDQMKTFGLSSEAKLVDMNTGLQVDAHGMPVDLAHLLSPDMQMQPKGDSTLTEGAEIDPVEAALAQMGASEQTEVE